MRLEATIPDPQGEAADKAAEELGLTQLEWFAHGETLDLSPAAAGRLAELTSKPAAPTPALKRAVRRRR